MVDGNHAALDRCSDPVGLRIGKRHRGDGRLAEEQIHFPYRTLSRDQTSKHLQAVNESLVATALWNESCRVAQRFVFITEFRRQAVQIRGVALPR